ncbi:MAG: adenylate/guanylate cyclase domain-containing protein [Alphaproteobacteria bacterium]|nr:adenylate/guanylate cyclase domain-containing protein [Alphaproteobacteria bacterium]
MANPDIAVWLADLGLGDYAEIFAENRIDFDVLAELEEADLRELGLALGDRKRLKKAIAGLSGEAATDTPAPSVEPAPAEGERRQVAVMFADISGFTRLSAQRDAEEIHQLLNRFFAAVDTVVQDFGGSVDKHIGDAVMAVFGAPVAHTDDPERAVRAALAVHDAAAKLDPPMRVHAGVAAGQVVASSTGSAAHLEYTVTGETVNLASRLTDLATAGETLISGGVQNAIGNRLDGENLGEKRLKGLLEPVVVWRADGLAETPSFVEGQFIGRGTEIGMFKSALAATRRDGRGQTIFVRGEAGIGKTRLLHEFQRLAEAEGFLSHGGQALDFGVGEGQDAVRMLLRGLLGLAPGAGQNLRAGAAERSIEAGLTAPEQRLHLNDLLNLPHAEEQRALYEAMDNDQRKRGRVETLVSLVQGLSARTPLLLRLEDLHWAAPALLDYLTGLVIAAGDCPVLLLLTSRLQNDPLDATWRASIGAAPFQAMDLGPLSVDEARDLVFDFAGVDSARAAACIERSGGNPLFLEQLLRSPDSGDGEAIPGSVQSVVQTRIDGLSGSDRAALQAASVLGLRFALDALRFIVGDADYQPDNLLKFDLVRPSEGDFQFSHALFRDAVHGSFLKGRRQDLHLRAADWFQDRDAVLHAEHLGQAESDLAPLAYQRAARAEAGAYRLESALNLLERGLALLPTAAERFDLTAQRAGLLRDLGRPADALEAWEEALTLAATDRQRCLAWIGIAAADRLAGLGEHGLDILDRAETVA